MKYTGNKTKEISFPLGGIGTGSIGLGGNGRFLDWEIFNRPSKGSLNGNSHIGIKAVKDGKSVAKALNGDLLKDYMGQYGKNQFSGFGFGPNAGTMCGFPHFENVEFDGEFPIANLKFSDSEFPGEVKMTAFNPFIPGDEDNSSIPAAFFEIEVKNTSGSQVSYQLAFTVRNPFEASINKNVSTDDAKILKFVCAEKDKSELEYGDLTLATDAADSVVQTYWYRGQWLDGLSTYWKEFSSVEGLKEREYDGATKFDVGVVAANLNLAPGEYKKVRFVLSWNVPNNCNYWEDTDDVKDENGNSKIWKNYYAVLFEDSVASAKYSLKNWDSLYDRTMKFKDTLYGTTLPDEVVEAAAANLAVLKSPTVLRLEDGSFYGWEGVHEEAGSCEGTCQHVWNYAYAMCFLFPKLERSIRDLEFKYSTDENGKMAFRMRLPLGREISDFRACLDGQMGAVIKMYREWKLSGDNEWLKDNWENIKKVVEYAWSDKNPDKWDINKDGVLEGRQHHTLDVELFGPCSWLEGMYLAALKAAAEMADFLGDTDKRIEYTDVYEKGREWVKNNLFNGRYFGQRIDLSDKSIIDEFENTESYWNDEKKEIKYQLGEGSSIDQMLGQWHCDILGLDDIFDKDQIDTALGEMMKNNFKSKMRDVVNCWRVFSLNDEAGTIICDYPEGTTKPVIPIPYCEETMTGFEYSFAGLLYSRGKDEDGRRVVKAIRDRYDGEKRNPWNEIECGSNYARSMASYALIPIIGGFEFDMPKGYIGFNPHNAENFKTIWSVDGAWGEFKINNNNVKLEVTEGEIKLTSFGVKFAKDVKSLKIDGKAIDYKFENGIIYFDETEIKESLELNI